MKKLFIFFVISLSFLSVAKGDTIYKTINKDRGIGGGNMFPIPAGDTLGIYVPIYKKDGKNYYIDCDIGMINGYLKKNWFIMRAGNFTPSGKQAFLFGAKLNVGHAWHRSVIIKTDDVYIENLKRVVYFTPNPEIPATHASGIMTVNCESRIS